MTAEEFIERALGDPAGEAARAHFVIDSLEKAEWAAKRWAKRIAESTQIRETRNRWVARIDEWADKEEARLAHDVGWLEAKLSEFHRGVLADDPRAKTVRLPSATLVARRSPNRLVVEDEDKVCAWASPFPHLQTALKRSVKLDKQALKRALVLPDATAGEPGEAVPALDPVTGELVPGAVWERGDVRYAVRDPEPDPDEGPAE